MYIDNNTSKFLQDIQEIPTYEGKGVEELIKSSRSSESGLLLYLYRDLLRSRLEAYKIENSASRKRRLKYLKKQEDDILQIISETKPTLANALKKL